MVQRLIENQIITELSGGKVIGLFGARRTGKTVLLRSVEEQIKKGQRVLVVQGDDLDISEILSVPRAGVLQNFVSGYDCLFIDEAQAIPNIGASLKLLVDSVPHLSIFVTGSSAFVLEKSLSEPLVGRMRYFYLFPFSEIELDEDFLTSRKNLDSKLIYGAYPQVTLTKNNSEKRHVLHSIKNGNLLKDILSLDGNKDSSFIVSLLRLIAHQIGNDVSYNELAVNLGVNMRTIVRYLELLEKSFILFSLPGFSRNLRKEISKTPRYFFWDNGIRNAIIGNFNPLAQRDDVGRLWENFCISERLKKVRYADEDKKHYFWRTYDRKEIDLIEEDGNTLHAFECKWKSEKSKKPKEFFDEYPGSTYEVINNDSYYQFLH